ncbi:MAG TPA: gliding motility-associated C-terminal domain-containing protein [Brumimicrobium sp.]|nr:gliding motility-associated C-terminal domain-containing protein [Brumimicrobium sp.]
MVGNYFRISLIGFFWSLSFLSFSQFPGCPAVDAGPDVTLDCTETCTTLTAFPFETGATTSYTVASIPYAPPIPFNQPGGTAVSVGTDDVWSPVINLPFSFCFYGQTYTQATIGSNGAISLGNGRTGGQPWSFTASCPSAALNSMGNIFGVLHDMEPGTSAGGSVRYYLLGEAPCRILAVVFENLPHYNSDNCPGARSSSMMVLYETTNAIDVFVQRKDLCTNWNYGNAVIGIQRNGGGAGIAAPGRNTGTWAVNTSNSEAWRFSPNGASIYTFRWLDENNNVISTDKTITVCPTISTTYTAEATYTPCAGGAPIVVSDQVVVNPAADLPNISAPNDFSVCLGSPVNLQANNPDGHTVTWDNGVVDGVPFTPTAPGTTVYSVSATVGTCTATDDVAVTVNPLPNVDAGADLAICNGESVTLSGSGATTYAWDNGVVDGVPFTATTSATYTVTGTDANECENTDQVSIVINPDPTATIDGAAEVCQNGGNPTITFTGGNGTAPYTFTYNINGGANQTATSTGNIATVAAPTGTVGTFTYNLVSVVDANGCSVPVTGDAIIIVNPLPTATVAGTTEVCLGEAAPTITFTGANGTAPYTFTYSINGGTSQTVTSTGDVATVTVPTGTAGSFEYEISSVVDASSTTCSNTVTGQIATVIVNTLPTATIAGTTEVCQDDTAPTITFTGANGTAPYTFTYTVNGGAPQTVTSTGNSATVTAPTVTAGTFVYELTNVEDASSSICESTVTSQTATVIVNPLPSAVIDSDATIIVCQDDAEPTISFTGANGTAPYTFTYTINGGAPQTVTSTGNSVTVSAPTGTAGTYVYALTNIEDASSTTCGDVVPPTQTTTVTVNPLPSAVVSSDATIIVCQDDAEPTITFTGSNGTAPYIFTYTIDGGAPQTVTSTGNTATVTAPTGTAGTFVYEVISVVDASTTVCENTISSQSTTVIVNPLPNAVVDSDATIMVCENGTAPTVSFTGTDGTAPYTFTYTINGGAPQTVTSTGNTATVTAPTGTAGTYVYELTNVADASTTICGNVIASVQTTTVIVNPLPTATIAGTTDVCQSGTAPTLTFTGANGTAPYTFTYTINGGTPQTVTSTGDIATVNAPTGTAGTFTYEITSVVDGSSTTCSNTVTGQTASVLVNPSPSATINGTVDICQDDAPPVITFTGSNGTAPYTFTYTVNGGAPQTATSTGNTATVSVPTDVEGTFVYEVISVQDASSTACISTVTNQSATIIVNVAPNASVSSSATITICQDDTEPIITFTGTQGEAPFVFTYTINGGADQTITSTGNSASVTVPTGIAGTFVYDLVSIQDASSTACSNTVNSQSSTVIVNPLPTATIAGTTDVCQDDTEPTITFTGANGTAPYTFTYTVNGGATQTVTSTGDVATVTVPTGAAGTFTYNLVSVIDGTSTTCSNVVTGQTASVLVNPLPSAVVDTDATVIVCEDDAEPTITFTGATGTAPYTFTYTINGGTPQTVTSTGNTATITAPTGTAGTFEYVLTNVQDASSTACGNVVPSTQTTTIIVNPLPTASIAGTIDVCQDDAEPTITFTGADGTAPYTFTYNINGGTAQTVTSTGDEATVTAPTGTDGTFIYTLISVADASATVCNNAVADQSATVIVNPLPTASIAGTIDVCEDGTAPTITFTGANGTAPYTFTYNINGGTDQTVTSTGNTATVSAPTGTDGTFVYELTSVQDASSTTCINAVATQTATVIVNPLPTATIAGTIDVCQDDSAPTITFTGADGTAPYTFTYTINGGASQTITTPSNSVTVTAPTGTAGTFVYELTSVQDASSTTCLNDVVGQTATVLVNPLPTATIAGTMDICQDDTEPTITFTGANGTAPYTFTYTVNGGSAMTVTSTGNTATVTAPTGTSGTFTYNLTSVQDASSTTCSNGVSGQTATILVNPLPSAAISSSATVIVCQNDGEPVVSFTGTGGTAPYTFTYTINGGAPQTVTSVGNTGTVLAPTSTAGTFVYDLISLQDASSTACSNTVSAQSTTIIVNPLPSATITGSTDVCQNGAAPTITLTGSEGTAPYSFTYSINNGPAQTVISSGNTITLSVPTFSPGTFTYQLLSVQDASTTTCVSNITNQTAVIVVNPLPLATISASGDACFGDINLPTVIFTGMNGTAPYTFTYSVDGGINQTVVSSGNTAVIPVPTNAVGTVTYELISVQDASSTSCSNDASGTVSITVNPLPTATMSGSTTVCENEEYPHILFNGADGTGNYLFVYNINNGPDKTVQTYGGNTSSVGVPTENPGTYGYYLTTVIDVATGCSNNVNLVEVVEVAPGPIASFYPSPQDLYSYNWTSQMVNQTQGGSTYHWDFGDGLGTSNEFSPVHNFPHNESNSYVVTLTATSAEGCVDTTSVVVDFTEELLFYVPNTFTPDEDGVNETFKPILTAGFDPQRYTLYIFNRWGELMFESHNAEVGWNGTYGVDGELCRDGTYVWKIEVRTTMDTRHVKTFVGHVNLLR